MADNFHTGNNCFRFHAWTLQHVLHYAPPSSAITLQQAWLYQLAPNLTTDRPTNH